MDVPKVSTPPATQTQVASNQSTDAATNPNNGKLEKAGNGVVVGGGGSGGQAGGIEWNKDKFDIPDDLLA